MAIVLSLSIFPFYILARKEGERRQWSSAAVFVETKNWGFLLSGLIFEEGGSEKGVVIQLGACERLWFFGGADKRELFVRS